MNERIPVRFGLTCGQVPEFPETCAWVDMLRWAICVVDPEPPGTLRFLAGCLAYALRNDGRITTEQARVARDIIRRLREDHGNGDLLCQMTPDDDMALASMTPEGSA